MRKRWERVLALLLALALLAGCAPAADADGPEIEIADMEDNAAGVVTPGGDSSGLEAASMHLRRTQGGVRVSDAQGRNVRPRDDLGLYSDYQVATQDESYAWIDLDRVKLTKLDQTSEICIQQEGRHLEIDVQRGSLFFNITEPLADDETLDIRASTLLVGIRGTCGWVEVPDSERMDVYLLEGAAEVSVTDTRGRVTTAQVRGGEVAHLALNRRDQDDTPITLDAFTAAQVPAFALEEVREDAALCEKIEGETGMDLYQYDSEAAVRAALQNVAYVGDASACAMSAQQAEAFAQVLEARMAAAQDAFRGVSGTESTLRCVAALADAGDGIPILLYGCYAETVENGYVIPWDIALAIDEAAHPGIERLEIWQWQDGRAVRFPQVGVTKVYPGYLLIKSMGNFPPDSAAWVYPLSGGTAAAAYTTQGRAQGIWDDASQTYHYEYTVNDAPAAMEAYEAWSARWEPEGPALYFYGSDRTSGDGGVLYDGFSPAEDVLAALRGGGAPRETADSTRTMSIYDPQSLIRRTVVNTGVPNLTIYSEIPVLPADSDANRRVNETFQAMEDQYLAGAADNAAYARENPSPYGDPYEDSWSAAVTFPTARIVSVQRQHYSYFGQPHPASESQYLNFDAATGEALTLDQAADAGAAEIQTYILQVLTQRNQESNAIFLDSFQDRPASAYMYTVDGGRITVVFDRNDGTYYAAGGIEPIELPFPLRAELQ
ncbi:MAG: hypothetical protein HFF17_01870 [Oscillospiraceae bacterium]|nr:hypothetical protein [Oscillospiraceae bacterium]